MVIIDSNNTVVIQMADYKEKIVEYGDYVTYYSKEKNFTFEIQIDDSYKYYDLKTASIGKKVGDWIGKYLIQKKQSNCVNVIVYDSDDDLYAQKKKSSFQFTNMNILKKIKIKEYTMNKKTVENVDIKIKYDLIAKNIPIYLYKKSMNIYHIYIHKEDYIQQIFDDKKIVLKVHGRLFKPRNISFTSYDNDENVTFENFPKYLVGIHDFIVRSNLNRCVYKEHSLISITTSVSILTSGGIIEEKFNAMYCEKCNKYYILESTYENLKRIGHICCKVIEYDDVIGNLSNFNEWQKKSLLAMYGYNVNSTHALSTEKRHTVLDFLIQNKIMTPSKIINHLEMQIRLRRNMKTMKKAIEKWRDDIEYLYDYNKHDSNVIVRSIYKGHK